MTILTSLLFSAGLLAQTPPPPPPPPPPPARQNTARDTPFRAPTGTGTLSGKVVSDESSPRPLRRATVTLRADGYRSGWTFVTDETGVFTFKALPAGRYTLSASKPTFVTMPYGALKPGRPGQSILLADGETRANIAMKLPKGAVITGTVRDEFGNPVPNTQVQAVRMVMRSGERTQVFSGGASSVRTDDRGIYRAFGLVAGEYTVSTTSLFGFTDTQRLRRVSATDIDAALRSANAATPAAPSATTTEAQGITAAPVFYPGTVIAAQAGTITLAVGEERPGIDITMQYVASVNVEGRLVGPDGKVPQAVTLTMMEVGGSGLARPRFGRPSPTDGKFSFNGLSPGQYVVTARATNTQATNEEDRNAPLFARADVTITGQKVADLVLTLDNGATVGGTVAVDPSATAAPDFRQISIALEPMIGKNDIALGVSPVSPDAGGKFSIKGVTPGRYRLVASSRNGGQWNATSATVDGRNALDDGLYVSSADLDGVNVTLTDQATELSGVLQDASGRSALDFYIIAFPTDPKFWYQDSRRIKTARPGSDGKYLIKNLPPGDYRIAAVTDVETGEWFDASFLQQLVAASATLALTDGEKKSFPLKIGGD